MSSAHATGKESIVAGHLQKTVAAKSGRVRVDEIDGP